MTNILTPKKRYDLQTRLQEIQQTRANNRARERSLVDRVQKLKSQPLVSRQGDLKANLLKILPKHMAPGNVGDINEVLWPFWFPFDFDFGTNPTFTINSRLSEIVQIDQEAGFLLTHISRDHVDPGPSGYQAPLQATIRDLQSTRQFNSEPIPIQMIGFKAQPTYLDTPHFFLPNARIQMDLSCWLPVGDTFAVQGSGEHQFVLGGYRIRNKNAAKVIASIFV